MTAGQWMAANPNDAGDHGRPHPWSVVCDVAPFCEPNVPVLDRIAREVEVESIAASVALLRKHIAYGLTVQAGDEEWAFKVGALGATLRIVDEGLAALVERIGG